MLVQPQLEMHPHYGKVAAAGGELQIERAGVGLGWFFEEAEDSLRVAENVRWAAEAPHAPPHRLHGHFCADGCRSSLRIRKLFAVADGSKGNVVSDGQS